MILEELLFVDRRLPLYGIDGKTQRLDAFFELRLIIHIGVEHHISTEEVDLHILFPLLFQEFADSKGTVGTGHSFYFPIRSFHAAKLLNMMRREKE